MDIKNNIPITHKEFLTLFKGTPHRQFHQSPHFGKARLACAKLAGKNVFELVLGTPAWTTYGALVCTGSIIVISYQAFLHLVLKKEHADKIKINSYGLLDNFLHVTAYPYVRIGMIGKLFCATIYPKIHFRDPEKFTLKKQSDYYDKEVVSLGQKIIKRTKKNHTDLINYVNDLLEAKHKAKISNILEDDKVIEFYKEELSLLDALWEKEAYEKSDFKDLEEFLNRETPEGTSDDSSDEEV